MPKAIEVHIGTAIDRDDRLILDLVVSDVFLNAGYSEATGRLDDRPCVLKDVANGRSDLVGVDGDDLIHELLA